jgi:hypothetical protein
MHEWPYQIGRICKDIRLGCILLAIEEKMICFFLLWILLPRVSKSLSRIYQVPPGLFPSGNMPSVANEEYFVEAILQVHPSPSRSPEDNLQV